MEELFRIPLAEQPPSMTHRVTYVAPAPAPDLAIFNRPPTEAEDPEREFSRVPAERSHCKNWFITVNNPDITPDQVEGLLQSNSHFQYAAFQAEIGEQGTPHYHIYCQFNNRVRFNYIKSLFPTAHIEVCFKPASCRDYCMKDDTRVQGPWQIGEWDGDVHGTRSDLKQVADLLKQGASLIEVARQFPTFIIHYSRGIEKLQTLLNRPTKIRDPPEVTLHFGPPGTGKSYRIWSSIPDDEDWFAKPFDRWYDGYDGQPWAIFEEHAGGWSGTKLVELLRDLDRYPNQVPIKGGFSWFIPKHIIFSTNIHPLKWYDYSQRPDHYTALIRRFTAVHLYSAVGSPIRVITDALELDEWFRTEPLGDNHPFFPGQITDDNTRPIFDNQGNFII